MIVYTTKLHLKKVLAGVVAVCAVICAIAWLAPDGDSAIQTANRSATSLAGTKLKDNEARVTFLHQYGWSVDEMPVSELEVQIPETFDEAYLGYNDVQLRQGLDLTKSRGKKATLYTYHLTEHPSGEEGVTANLLVRRNRLIAADIASAAANGFIHGVTETYTAPSSETTETPSQPTAASSQEGQQKDAPAKTE